MGSAQQFLSELRRRHVARALVVWCVVAFAVLQIYEPVMHGLHIPDWTLSLVVVLLGLGFPVAVALGWIFDLTAAGLARTPDADNDDKVARLRGGRLLLVITGLGLLAAAPGVAFYLLRQGAARPAVEANRAQPKAMPSVAVMPFADLSPQGDQQYFSEGLSDEILNALARVEGLRVAGHASSFSLEGKHEDLAGIGQKLGVSAVLEGSVRRDGKRVRVTAQVSEVTSGRQLWSHNYDRELVDVFAVQDEIAAAVVSALRVKLLPGDEPSTQAYRTSNPEVHNQYLMGHRFFARESKDGQRRAVEAFAKAVRLEPGYAPAQAGLALSLVLNRAFHWDAAGWGEDGKRALAAADKAVSLDPELAEAWAARGKARSWVAWNWTGAQADLERAVHLNPGDALVQQQYAALLASLGRLPEAIAVQRRATELDPLRGQAWHLLGYWANLNGEFSLGWSAADRSLELNPDSEVAWARHFQSLLWQGKPEAALALLAAEHRRCFACVAKAERDLGHTETAQRALDALLSQANESEPYDVAGVYAWWGERDKAFEWLGRAAAQHHPDLVFAKVDPNLRKLRTDPRWVPFLERMNLPVDGTQ